MKIKKPNKTKELAKYFLDTMSELSNTCVTKNIRGFARGRFFILHILKMYQDGFISPHELAMTSEVSTARVATVLNSLEKEGFIKRKIDKSDRRKILVSLTRKGEKELASAYKKICSQIETLIKHMNYDDIKTYLELTKKINKTVKEIYA